MTTILTSITSIRIMSIRVGSKFNPIQRLKFLSPRLTKIICNRYKVTSAKDPVSNKASLKINRLAQRQNQMLEARQISQITILQEANLRLLSLGTKLSSLVDKIFKQ